MPLPWRRKAVAKRPGRLSGDADWGLWEVCLYLVTPITVPKQPSNKVLDLGHCPGYFVRYYLPLQQHGPAGFRLHGLWGLLAQL